MRCPNLSAAFDEIMWKGSIRVASTRICHQTYWHLRRAGALRGRGEHTADQAIR
jgi:hypothetical protein